MITQTQAQLILDERRIVCETEISRKRISLHTDNRVQTGKSLYNSVTGLQEIMLAGAAAETIQLNTSLTYLVLPVEGAVRCITIVDQTTIAAGQVCIISARDASELVLENPFTDYLVTILVITVVNPNPANMAAAYTYQDLNNHFNTLMPVLLQPRQYNKNIMAMKLGLFNGRGEAQYTPLLNSITTVFVLQGAFEVDGRLLHQGDTLAIWDAPGIEMEALSSRAMLLLLETSLTKFSETHYLY